LVDDDFILCVKKKNQMVIIKKPDGDNKKKPDGDNKK
jgi:hypothetical protein